MFMAFSKVQIRALALAHRYGGLNPIISLHCLSTGRIECYKLVIRHVSFEIIKHAFACF
jgi:hypothetical protein